jgi:hypothetical protein
MADKSSTGSEGEFCAQTGTAAENAARIRIAIFQFIRF